nr:oleate hydratase [Brucepastera parasyntrophica]
MYHSNGNYEAFAHPAKPEGVDKKSAYLVGGGLAGLAAAAFLLRDAQMKGEHIHVLEQLKIPGGSLDGICEPQGWVIRGEGKWKTILNVSGTFSGQYPRLKQKVFQFWMNFTG